MTCNFNFNNKLTGFRVYAHTNYMRRRQLWLDLLRVTVVNGPWTIIADFNAITGSHEKKGGSLPSQISCDTFIAFSNTANLIHMDIVRADFTWFNGRRGRIHTEVRLDKTLCNAN